MAEVALDRPNIGSLVHEVESRAVAKHVRVNRQMRQAGRLGYQADHVPDRDAGERLAALRYEERVAIGGHIHLRPLQQPRLHRLALAVVELVWSRVATFDPINVLSY